jgi:hypothetical protein
MFELINKIHEKEVAHLKKNSNYFNQKSNGVNTKILALLDECTHNNSSREERKLLSAIEDESTELFLIEKDTLLLYSNTEYLQKINGVKQNIGRLAKVQVEKGKSQKLNSREALASSNLFSQIEIYILIAIAIVVQIIVIYPSKSIDAED